MEMSRSGQLGACPAIARAAKLGQAPIRQRPWGNERVMARVLGAVCATVRAWLLTIN